MHSQKKSYLVIFMFFFTACVKGTGEAFWFSLNGPEHSRTTNYYVDSKDGNDDNNGLTPAHPWKSIHKVQATALQPGDVVRFKRGSEYAGCLIIRNSGTEARHITLSDYGNPHESAPKFTNPNFTQGEFGNCIRIKGSYITVENLYFHHTLSFVEGNYQSDGGWLVWEMGAVYIDKGAEHCIIRNNEMYDCVAGIRSYGKYALISGNYIHDCNRPLKQWNWGPLGIWLGGDYQTVVHNTVINMQVQDSDPSHFTNGVGGGAIEIDDGRYPKSHITLSYNFTRDNCGFLETVFNDVVSNPEYRDWNISFNVSDDYQAFVKLRFAKNCSVENNTIIRRKINATELGVFVLKGNNTFNKVRNNIIVTDKNIKIFNIVGKATPSTIIQNNLYHAIGTLVMGNEGPGTVPYFGDPFFRNITGTQAEDFDIRAGSPVINKGMDLGYQFDFSGSRIPFGNAPDIGAFEYYPSIKNNLSQEK